MVIERYVPLSLFVSSFFIHTFMSCELEDTWEGIRAKKPTILWFGCVKYFRRSYSSHCVNGNAVCMRLQTNFLWKLTWPVSKANSFMFS